MVQLFSSLALARPSRRPAPQAPRPCLRLHCIGVGIGERHAAPAPHASIPLKADGRQRHPARNWVTAMREGKGNDVVSHLHDSRTGVNTGACHSPDHDLTQKHSTFLCPCSQKTHAASREYVFQEPPESFTTLNRS
jgi:hypothetical protein